MSAAPKPEKAADDGPAKKGGKKKLILIAGLVLLLGGGGAGAWFSGILPKMLGKSDTEEHAAAEGAEEKHGEKPAEKHGEKPAEKHGEKPAEKPAEKHGEKPAGENRGTEHGEKQAEKKGEGAVPSNPLFVDLPDIIANLNTGPRRATYVKLRAKLELAKSEDNATVQAAMPRVLDLFQGYLREMRPEELRGTAGTYRLREELLARTNLAVPPARVVAVLFTEMIVQ